MAMAVMGKGPRFPFEKGQNVSGREQGAGRTHQKECGGCSLLLKCESLERRRMGRRRGHRRLESARRGVGGASVRRRRRRR